MCIYIDIIDRYTSTCIWFVVSYTGRAHFKLSTIQTPTVPFFLVQVTTPVRLALPGRVCFQCQGTSSGQAESSCKKGMSGLPTTTRSCHRSSHGRKKNEGTRTLLRVIPSASLACSTPASSTYICQGFHPARGSPGSPAAKFSFYMTANC